MFYRIATCISCPWSERPESSYWGKKREKKGQSVFFPSAGIAETSLAAKSPRPFLRERSAYRNQWRMLAVADRRGAAQNGRRFMPPGDPGQRSSQDVSDPHARARVSYRPRPRGSLTSWLPVSVLKRNRLANVPANRPAFVPRMRRGSAPKPALNPDRQPGQVVAGRSPSCR
jgi:hypothetical protein